MSIHHHQKTRQLEMDKELKDTAILIRDDDHDLFTRTFRLSLLQKSIAMHSERKTQASELLSAMADRLHSSRLATLAFRICLDAFTRVKKVMDDMIPALRSESVHVVISDFQCLDKIWIFGCLLRMFGWLWLWLLTYLGMCFFFHDKFTAKLRSEK